MKKESKLSLENIFMVFGIILLIISFFIPFHLSKSAAKLLGDVATPFVSAAAFLLLVSANIMQQRELSLQRTELKHTREVFEEQSKTMSRQRFENTFFNMVNLHHTILGNLKIDTALTTRYNFSRPIDSGGSELIFNLFEEFNYRALKAYREFKFNKYLSEGEIQEVFHSVYPKYEKNRLLEELEKLRGKGHFFNDINEYKTLKKQIECGSDSFIEQPRLQRIVMQHPYKINQVDNVKVSLRNILLTLPDAYHTVEYHEKMSDDFGIEKNYEWEKIKRNCYETFYKKLEYIFGHYYRNLYRIVKYINESDMIDDLEKKEFRGILRAQLSSYELMMLFYNVVYSEKGAKFKRQIQKKDFFDDHLMQDSFVWNDDLGQLKEVE